VESRITVKNNHPDQTNIINDNVNNISKQFVLSQRKVQKNEASNKSCLVQKKKKKLRGSPEILTQNVPAFS